MNQDKQYYVYEHRHPTTKQLVYIGMGSGHRAFTCPNDKSVHRSKEHAKWMWSLLRQAYTPEQWTTIVARGLTKAEALQQEKQLIKEFNPQYNKLHSPTHWTEHRAVNPEQVNFMKNLREMGYGYKQIALIVGGDANKAMTIWRQVTYVTG